MSPEFIQKSPELTQKNSELNPFSKGPYTSTLWTHTNSKPRGKTPWIFYFFTQLTRLKVFFRTTHPPKSRLPCSVIISDSLSLLPFSLWGPLWRYTLFWELCESCVRVESCVTQLTYPLKSTMYGLHGLLCLFCKRDIAKRHSPCECRALLRRMSGLACIHTHTHTHIHTRTNAF